MMLLIAVGALAGFGVGAYSWLRPQRRVDAFEVIGASILLGSAFLSALLFLFSQFVRGNALIGVILTLGVLFGGMGICRLRRAEWDSVSGARLFTGLMAIALLLVIWQASARPLGGDGVFNFEVRAHLAWQNGGRIPTAFFADPSRAEMHPSYPLFLPLNELWIYLCLGEPNQSTVKILGVLWFAASACLTFSQLRRATKRIEPGLIAVGLMLIVPMVVFYPSGAVWMWGDFPLGAIATAAVLYLREYRTERTGLACTAAMMATLPWVKREGVIIGFALLMVLAWDALRRREWRAVAWAGLPFAVVTIAWSAFIKSVGAPRVTDMAEPSAALFLQNIDRLPRIAVIALRELFVWQRWSLLWPVALIATIRIIREPSLAPWRFLPLVIGMVIAVYAGFYTFSAWTNLAWQMLTSFPRLLLAPAMIAMVLVAAAFPPSPQTPEDR